VFTERIHDMYGIVLVVVGAIETGKTKIGHGRD